VKAAAGLQRPCLRDSHGLQPSMIRRTGIGIAEEVRKALLGK
jgi:hypothetical protein